MTYYRVARRAARRGAGRPVRLRRLIRPRGGPGVDGSTMGGPLPSGALRTLNPRHSAYAHTHATGGHQLHCLPYTDPAGGGSGRGRGRDRGGGRGRQQQQAGSIATCRPNRFLRFFCYGRTTHHCTEFWSCLSPQRQQFSVRTGTNDIEIN